MFRNAYTNSKCAPTRAQLLTGRHALRTGIGIPANAVLDLSEETLPELLAGTHLNAAIGKWHVGPSGDADHPIQSGFDYFAGSLGASVSAYDSWTKTINDTEPQRNDYRSAYGVCNRRRIGRGNRQDQRVR